VSTPSPDAIFAGSIVS